MKRYPLILFTLTYGFAAFSQQKTTDSLVLHFEYNRSVINPIAIARLDSFITTVPAASIKQVNVYGHCDFIGSNKYNDSLSRQRVLAAKIYLVNKGINTVLFTQEEGFGKRKPLDIATTDAARATNRRVEIIVTKEVITAPPPPPTPIIEATPVTKVPQPTLSEMIKDSSVKAGSKLIIPNLIFEGGRHFLQQGSYPTVKELLKIMQDNPNLVIEIQGHVCCQQNGLDGRDDDLRTNDLSVQRAKLIYEYLVDKGIASRRMKYMGFGSSQKIYPQELTPEQMAQNRRVEIKIIHK